MHTSFADQLAGLDLAGFSIGPAPLSTSDFPLGEAVVQTLEAVWSDLFALVTGTALEADAEDLDPRAPRRAAELVMDTRRRLTVNVNEELALEALCFRLEFVLRKPG